MNVLNLQRKQKYLDRCWYCQSLLFHLFIWLQTPWSLRQTPRNKRTFFHPHSPNPSFQRMQSVWPNAAGNNVHRCIFRQDPRCRLAKARQSRKSITLVPRPGQHVDLSHFIKTTLPLVRCGYRWRCVRTRLEWRAATIFNPCETLPGSQHTCSYTMEWQHIRLPPPKRCVRGGWVVCFVVFPHNGWPFEVGAEKCSYNRLECLEQVNVGKTSCHHWKILV